MIRRTACLATLCALVVGPAAGQEPATPTPPPTKGAARQAFARWRTTEQAAGDAALRLARRDDTTGNYAGQILGDWRFRQTDQYRRVVAALRADILDPALVKSMSLPRLTRTAARRQ